MTHLRALTQPHLLERIRSGSDCGLRELSELVEGSADCHARYLLRFPEEQARLTQALEVVFLISEEAVSEGVISETDHLLRFVRTLVRSQAHSILNPHPRHASGLQLIHRIRAR